MVSQNFWPFVVAIAILIGIPSTAISQQASPSSRQTIGLQAVKEVSSRYQIDPTIPMPHTDKRLPSNGVWSIDAETPSECPQATDPCVRILYRVPAANISCEWVVLIVNEKHKGVILNLNEDAVRYFAGNALERNEVEIISGSHKQPVYPMVARESHIQGTVKLLVHVSASGEVDKIVPITGPDELRFASVNAVKKWRYKPLIVESNTIPFQIPVDVNFSISR